MCVVGCRARLSERLDTAGPDSLWVGPVGWFRFRSPGGGVGLCGWVYPDGVLAISEIPQSRSLKFLTSWG